MADRVAACDWSASPLGPMEGWPEALKVAFQIMMSSRFPMFIWWGPDLINLYNDAYAPMLGKRHPSAFTRPASEVWHEIWDVVGGQADLVFRQRQSSWNEEMLLVMERYGYAEETYFTWSYSPIGGGTGDAEGLYCAVTEDTPKVIGRRRLKSLRELATATADLRTAPEAFAVSATVLNRNPYDLPFALLYRFEADGKTAALAGSAGLDEANCGAPVRVSVDAASNPWGLDLRSGAVRVIVDLDQCFSAVPQGPWPDPPVEALVLPFAKRSEEQPAGFMIAGISRYTKLDDDYRGFLELAAGHIDTAVSNALAYEAEHKRAEALTELNRAKTAFFSSVSHEFRTPLTLILGPLEDALANRHGILPMGAARDLGISHRNALRLLKLVNTLLDFARIEAGRIQVVYEATNLALLTKDVASVFQSAMERAGLKFVIDTPPLDEPVYVDREMWEKIVLNLLSNAFKFTFEGAIRVTLRAAGGVAQLTVADTGTGIPTEELPRIFERFHQVTGARGRSFEGSGIGLALIQELVKLHGGTVSVESQLSRGSSFTVSIPLGKDHLPADRIGVSRTQVSTAARAEAYVQEALGTLPESLDSGYRAGGSAPGVSAEEEELVRVSAVDVVRPRIVIADDNSDMRAYARHLLSWNYDVTAVADGVEALDAIQANPPNLVLTDVMMPRMDGFALLRALRDDPRTRDLPVILLSARAGEEERLEGLETGADEYMTKPFSGRELLARVEGALKLQRVRSENNRILLESERRLTRLVAVLTQLHRWSRLSTTETQSSLLSILHGIIDLHETNRGLIAAGGNGAPAVVAVSVGFDGLQNWLAETRDAVLAAGRIAFETNRPVIIEDTDSHPAFAGHRDAARNIGFRSVSSFPLQSRCGECMAVVSVYFPGPQSPDEFQSELAELYTRQAADFIERLWAGQRWPGKKWQD